MEMHQYSAPVQGGDPYLIDQIVNQIKSQGTFDQWRRECLADVDTKPAYQNLTLRVDNAVASFLGKQRWRPELVKNQVRENLRKHILELGFIEKGVDRIVEQVVQPKIGPLFRPAVESAIYSFLGIQKPQKPIEVSDNQEEDEMMETREFIERPFTDVRKVFKPMPVSIPLHPEDDTPPPGDDGFELDAITPSPEGYSKASERRKSCGAEDLPDDVSDVSMEDVSSSRVVGPKTPTTEMDLEPLERICSPISQSSSNGQSGSGKKATSKGQPSLK
nr:EOG090X0B7I [Sida crystallina]